MNLIKGANGIALYNSCWTIEYPKDTYESLFNLLHP